MAKRAAVIDRRNAILNENSTFDVVSLSSTDTDTDIMWKDIYHKYLLSYKKYYSFLKFIPSRILEHFLTLPGTTFVQELAQLPTDESGAFYRLRDIWLPIVEHCYRHIIDVMTQYLLQLDINNDYGILELLPEGPYEYKNVALREGDIVIDAGVCLGDFSLLAAYKSGPDGRVIGFEASQYIIDSLLQPAIDLNEAIADRIRIEHYALSNQVGTIAFSFDLNSLGVGKIPPLSSHLAISPESDEKTVNTITVDEYTHQMDLSKIDFIKADIEGAERDMLRGASGVLRDFAPRLAICTYHLPDDPQILEQIVLDANPKYKIIHKFCKMYAYVPDAK